MSTGRGSSLNDRLAHALSSSMKGIEILGPEELAKILRATDVTVSSHEISNFWRFVSTRLRHGTHAVDVPPWLAQAFTALIHGINPKVVCDPWAGVGLLMASLKDVVGNAEVIALAPIESDVALGRVLVPAASWRNGNPQLLLRELDKEIDVAASVLPWGARASFPLVAETTVGRVEIKDDLGHLLLTAASLRLSPTGVGLFIVSRTFFRGTSIQRRFAELGLGVEAALALPAGTFLPHARISGYLIVVRRRLIERMFAAELTLEPETNRQVIENLLHRREGGSLAMGRFVDPLNFAGLDAIRATEQLAELASRFGVPSRTLGEFALELVVGRAGDEFEFRQQPNAIYVPLIGVSDVQESISDLTLKAQNYAQVVIDPDVSSAAFVARFLNSDVGKELREQWKTGTIIRKLSAHTLRALPMYVVDRDAQVKLLALEADIAAQSNIVRELANEIADLRRDVWERPSEHEAIREHLGVLSRRLEGPIAQHSGERLEQWFETLPFPLASILRSWQASASADFKAKHEHLLHFFEAVAEFVGIVLLSAFASSETHFAPHRAKLHQVLSRQKLSFDRASFGTWKAVVEYLGKQTRDLLRGSGGGGPDAGQTREMCAVWFADRSLRLPTAVASKEVAAILATTNKMRNDWSGHGGVLGQVEARLRNEQMVEEVHRLREAFGDVWSTTQLIQAIYTRPRRGAFENEVAILNGSNSEFLKDTRRMDTFLDVERLYLATAGTGSALKLLPLVQVGPSPESAKNACYFYSRLERGGARFVSYHFADQPELSGEFADVLEAIRFVGAVND
ncbi:MAG: hypothetical protein P3A27_05055 [Gemmatimonadota bacterium]|nr:hypothetical protein [Gemmatimonadota bacterium]